MAFLLGTDEDVSHHAAWWRTSPRERGWLEASVFFFTMPSVFEVRKSSVPSHAKANGAACAGSPNITVDLVLSASVISL